MHDITRTLQPDLNPETAEIFLARVRTGASPRAVAQAMGKDLAEMMRLVREHVEDAQTVLDLAVIDGAAQLQRDALRIADGPGIHNPEYLGDGDATRDKLRVDTRLRLIDRVSKARKPAISPKSGPSDMHNNAGIDLVRALADAVARGQRLAARDTALDVPVRDAE